jgi:hypothetical protein
MPEPAIMEHLPEPMREQFKVHFEAKLPGRANICSRYVVNAT